MYEQRIPIHLSHLSDPTNNFVHFFRLVLGNCSDFFAVAHTVVVIMMMMMIFILNLLF